MLNRSVPTDAPIVHLHYRDVGDAIRWLTAVLGFKEHYRYGDFDKPQGAQLLFGKSVFMLARARDGKPSPAEVGGSTGAVTLFVEDLEARLQKARQAGFKVREEINEPIYGERQFVVEDPEGHVWMFSEHVKDVEPTEWGAILADSNPKV